MRKGTGRQAKLHTAKHIDEIHIQELFYLLFFIFSCEIYTDVSHNTALFGRTENLIFLHCSQVLNLGYAPPPTSK